MGLGHYVIGMVTGLDYPNNIINPVIVVLMTKTKCPPTEDNAPANPGCIIREWLQETRVP